jgi:hypothetical protein
MEWTVNFFQYQAKQWTNRLQNSRSRGHLSYSLRMEAMWSRLACRAEEAFNEVKCKHPNPLDESNEMQ